MMTQYKYQKEYEAATKEYIENPRCTLEYLSRKYGFQRWGLSRWLHKHGIEVRQCPPMTEKLIIYDEAYRRYFDGESPASIATDLNIPDTYLRAQLKKKFPDQYRNGFDMPDEIINEHFFDALDTEEKAYWFGFIAADGTVRNERFSIELSDIDESHLKKFADTMGSGIPIGHRATRPLANIYINRKYMAQKLIEFGLVPNKTDYGLLDASIFKGFERDFLRGYNDGDGFIESRNLNKYRNVITVKAPGFIPTLMDMLDEYHPRLESLGSFSRIHIERKKEFFKFLNDLYGHATVYLDRKYKIYQDRINALSGRHCGRPE